MQWRVADSTELSSRAVAAPYLSHEWIIHLIAIKITIDLAYWIQYEASRLAVFTRLSIKRCTGDTVR